MHLEVLRCERENGDSGGDAQFRSHEHDSLRPEAGAGEDALQRREEDAEHEEDGTGNDDTCHPVAVVEDGLLPGSASGWLHRTA